MSWVSHTSTMPSAADFKKGFQLQRGQLIDVLPEDEQALPDVDHARPSSAELLGFEFRLLVFKSSFQHLVVKKHERYDFPAVISLCTVAKHEGKEKGETGAPLPQQDDPEAGATPAVNPRVWCAVTKALRRHVVQFEHCIINSQYGSPYECKLGKVKLLEATWSKKHKRFELTYKATGTSFRRHDLESEFDKSVRTTTEPVIDIKSDDIAPLITDLRVLKSRFVKTKCNTCGESVPPGLQIAKSYLSDTARGGWSHLRCIVKARRTDNWSFSADDKLQLNKVLEARKAAAKKARQVAAERKRKGSTRQKQPARKIHKTTQQPSPSKAKSRSSRRKPSNRHKIAPVAEKQ